MDSSNNYNLKKRKGYPTAMQKSRLVSLLEADHELRSGKFSSSFTTKDAMARWIRITEELNSIPGSNKSWKEWRKTWQDMRAKIKKRDVEVRRSSILTDGGQPAPALSNVNASNPIYSASQIDMCGIDVSPTSKHTIPTSQIASMWEIVNVQLEDVGEVKETMEMTENNLLIKNNLDSENIDEETSPNPHISKGLAVVKLEFQENEEDLDITRTSIQSTCKDSNSMVEIVKKRREQRKQHLRLKSLLRRREIRQNNMLFKKIFSQMHRQTDALISIANSVKRIANVLNK